MPKRNDPYSRPINATRPEGQMLQGEFYGEPATDKALHGATGGRAVHQVRAMASVVPSWPDVEEPAKPRRGRPPGSKNKVATSSPKATTLSPETTTLNTDVTSPSNEQSAAITEDDLFG